MKTIKTKQIDGYTVVESVQSAGGFIDPEATKKIVAVEIAKTEVYQQIEALKNQMLEHAVKAREAQIKARQAKQGGKSYDEYWSAYKSEMEKFNAIQTELLPLATTLKSEFTRLTLEHAVYFNLPEGEELCEDDAADEISAALESAASNGTVIALQGGEIVEVVDNRGKRFYQKSGGRWVSAEITKLGETAKKSAIAESDLTDDQRAEIAEQNEADRVAALKPADKAAEKAAVLKSLAQAAASKKAELEITGDTQALETAQAWYQSEAAIVEAKYA